MNRFRMPIVAILVFLLTPLLPAMARPGLVPVHYRVSKSVSLGGPDRWDYVIFDPISHRVYAARGDRVTVVNSRSGALIGSVVSMPGGTHGIAIVHATDRGYTDDGKAGIVAVFDLKTLKVVKRIKAESDADGVVFDPSSGHVFVIDGDSGKLTVIDPKTDSVGATIDGGGGLEFGDTGDNGKFYVNGAENNEIVRIDTATNKADAHWPMPGSIKPHGLAIDRAHHRLFASCSNKVMMVMNADNGAVIATFPIGAGTDFALFDPKRELAFSSNRDGTLSVIAELSPDKFVALTPIPTKLGARTMALDPSIGRIYLVTADMIVDKSAAPNDLRHRYRIAPGWVRLLFLDKGA